jgi:hypothetical protein
MRIALALVVIGLVLVLFGLTSVTIGGPGQRPALTFQEFVVYLGLAAFVVAGIRAVWVLLAGHIGR